MDLPWLPPAPYTHKDRFGRQRQIGARVRRELTAVGLIPPPEPPPTEVELRWQAEDEWLSHHWCLAMD